MFVNNVTCLKQQQQPLAIHYDRDHSHSIVSNNVVVGNGGPDGLLVIKTFSICTGYDVIKVCPYVTSHRVHDISPIRGVARIFEGGFRKVRTCTHAQIVQRSQSVIICGSVWTSI